MTTSGSQGELDLLDDLLSGKYVAPPKKATKHSASQALAQQIQEEADSRYPIGALHTKLVITCSQCKTETFHITDRRIRMQSSITGRTSLIVQTSDLGADLTIEYRKESLVVPYCSACDTTREDYRR